MSPSMKRFVILYNLLIFLKIETLIDEIVSIRDLYQTNPSEFELKLTELEDRVLKYLG